MPSTHDIDGVRYVRARAIEIDAVVIRSCADKAMRRAGDDEPDLSLLAVAERLEYAGTNKLPVFRDWEFGEDLVHRATLVSPVIDVYLEVKVDGELGVGEMRWAYSLRIDPGPIGDNVWMDLPARKVEGRTSGSIELDEAKDELVLLAHHLIAMWNVALHLRREPLNRP